MYRRPRGTMSSLFVMLHPSYVHHRLFVLPWHSWMTVCFKRVDLKRFSSLSDFIMTAKWTSLRLARHLTGGIERGDQLFNLVPALWKMLLSFYGSNSILLYLKWQKKTSHSTGSLSARMKTMINLKVVNGNTIKFIIFPPSINVRS